MQKTTFALFLCITLFFSKITFAQYPNTFYVPSALTSKWSTAGSNFTASSNYRCVPITSISGSLNSNKLLNFTVINSFIANPANANTVIYFPSSTYLYYVDETINMKSNIVFKGNGGTSVFKAVSKSNSPAIGTLFNFNNCTNSGIECLTIDNRYLTGYGSKDDYKNTKFSNKSNIFISSNSNNCYINGITIYRGFGAAILNGGSKINITGCYIYDSWTHGSNSGTQGYGIVIDGNSCFSNLIENNVIKEMRHGIIIQTKAHDNVIAYNSVTGSWADRSTIDQKNSLDITFHTGGPYDNLIEGNYAEKMGADNKNGPTIQMWTPFGSIVIYQGTPCSETNGKRNTFYRNKVTNELLIEDLNLSSCPDFNDGQIVIGNQVDNYTIKSKNNKIYNNSKLNNTPLSHNASVGGSAKNLVSSISIGKSCYKTTAPVFIANANWPMFGINASISNILPAQARANTGGNASYAVCTNCENVLMITNSDDNTETFNSVEKQSELVLIENNEIKNDIANQLIVYPNPFSNQITVSFKNNDKRLKEIVIYDNLGKKVIEYTNNDNLNTIDLSYLDKGIYIITAKTANSFYSKKIIKY